jgi:hypothetical protein
MQALSRAISTNFGARPATGAGDFVGLYFKQYGIN